VDLTLSNTILALGPTSIAIAPVPPVGLAGPLGYTAISADRTIPYLPISQINNIYMSLPSYAYDCTQLIVLNSALVDP
jgi:hypothetical protein